MPQQRLDRAEVVAGLQKVGGKTVTKANGNTALFATLYFGTAISNISLREGFLP